VTPAPANLAATLAAIPDAARFLVPRPGDTELPATVIADPDWLAEQIRLRGQIWGIDDRRTLATLWWYSASTMLVTPGVLAIAAGGRYLSPRLEHTVIHHQPSSRFSGSHATQTLPGDDLAAFAAELRPTLAAVIGMLGPYVPRPRPLWAIASDAIAGRFAWAGNRTGHPDQAAALATRIVTTIGGPMPRPRYVTQFAQCRIQRNSCCLLYRVPGESPCSDCPRVDRSVS